MGVNCHFKAYAYKKEYNGQRVTLGISTTIQENRTRIGSFSLITYLSCSAHVSRSFKQSHRYASRTHLVTGNLTLS